MTVRRGDVVRVKSQEEILATLDRNGAVDGLPFMPEMLKFAGKQLPVFSVAHKTCDTVDRLGRMRELDNTVHLVGARCDGSAHGGCQAGCLLFWHESWVEGTGFTAQENDPPLATVETLQSVTQHGDLYSCQATEMRHASRPLPSYKLSQYVKDIRTRNVALGAYLKGLLITFFNLFQWVVAPRLPRRVRPFGGRVWPFYRGTGDGARVPSGELQPGDLVEVRPRAEILSTLNAANKNGGLLFDSEMLPFCGARARVDRRIDQIIDEPTGKMIKLRDCLVLEDVVCPGTYHAFCPRGGLPYWRETWLKKVDESA